MIESIDRIIITFGSSNFSNWIKSFNKITQFNIQYININIALETLQTRTGILIALSYKDMELLSKDNNLNKLKDYYDYVLATNYDTVKLLDNHQLFSQFMMDHNMSNLIPKVYDLKNDNISYPCILKLNVGGYGGNKTYVINNKTELEQKMGDTTNWIIKELICEKTEYTAHILAIDGIVIHIITYGTVYVFDNYIKRGSANIHIRDIDHSEYFVDIFRLLNYTGFACINYKIIDSIPKIFEINPRLGGSLVAETEDFEIMLNKLVEAIKK